MNRDEYQTTTAGEDIPPKSLWDGDGWKNNITEYNGFNVGIPDQEFPYLLAIDTDIPELQGIFTKLQQAKNAIDNYLQNNIQTRN
jgi:hypothetical protein